ncbi:MAG: hypothetical protein JO189_03880 [Deltaproteobacteria bacterium]|nr:hypothetical protein [Deltaproteobacteria bacterium]
MKSDPQYLPIIVLSEPSAAAPVLITTRGQHAGYGSVEFFTANIRNSNTRKDCLPGGFGIF